MKIVYEPYISKLKKNDTEINNKQTLFGIEYLSALRFFYNVLRYHGEVVSVENITNDN
jgi:hypothetical protein